MDGWFGVLPDARSLVVILGDFLQGVTRMLAETVFANLAAETFKAPYNAQLCGI